MKDLQVDSKNADPMARVGKHSLGNMSTEQRRATGGFILEELSRDRIRGFGGSRLKNLGGSA